MPLRRDGSSPAGAALGARLQPWISALQKLAPPAYIEEMALSADDGVPCTLWIGSHELFSRTTREMERLDRIGEALSILTLLAHADFDLWMREITTIWPMNEKLRAWIDYTLAPRVRNEPLFAIGLEVSEVQFANVEQLACIHDYNVLHTSPSAEYVALRTDLLEAMATEAYRATQHDALYSNVRVRIELDCFQQQHQDAAHMLQETLNVVDAQVESEREASARETVRSSSRPPALLPTPRFVIQDVSFTTTIAVVLGKEALSILRKLAAHGLRIGQIPQLCVIVRPPWLEKDPTKELVENVRFLTGIEEPTVPGVRMVSISDRFLPLVGTALLSALQQSPCVRAVEIKLSGASDDSDESDEDEDEDDDDPDDRSEAWQWVAYSLFSRDATHKLERLEMDLIWLQCIEVDAVREVLHATNPLAVLVNTVKDSNQAPSMQLQATRFCVVDPRQSSIDVISQPLADDTVTTRRPTTALRGSIETTRWHPSPMTTTVAATARNRAMLPCIPRIDITRLSDDSKDAVADLMELIGHGTRRVDLHEDLGDEPIDDWCARVLRACPRLEELQLRQAGVENLQFLIDAAAAGYCTLRELLMLYVGPTESSQHVCRFFEALSDPNHALTRHLRDLELWILMENQDVSDIIGSALQMLDQNRQLHTIRLGFRLTTPACALRKPEFEQAFAEQLDADVRIRTAPLEMRSKLALLSVVFAPTTTIETRAVHRLDSGVLSVVFQFAAQARTRNFTLSFSLPYTDYQE